MLSRKQDLYLLLAGLLVAVLAVGGCGNSSKTVIPQEPENPFAMARVGTDSTLEVMTWNLESFAKNGDTTADLVIKAIGALDVDIVGLQEIHSRLRFDDVVAGLDGWSGFKASSAGYDINLAFLYRENDHLQVDSIQEIMTDEDGPFPRNPLLLMGTFDGKPIGVIDNHLKCCGDGVINEGHAYDEETRRRDACLLLEDYILTNLSDRRMYILGDFNDELTDPMENNVFANFLGDEEHWLVADLPIAEGPSSGWSFPGWPSHLDHIIINQPLFAAAAGPEARIEVAQLYAYLNNGWTEYDRDISDHLPVILKLKP